jgi:hypothetical protein
MCAISFAQDSQSLGDVARQLRQKKQTQAKDASAKQVATNDGEPAASDAAPSKTPIVVTNDEGPAQPSTKSQKKSEPDSQQTPADREAQGEKWKSRIQDQKNSVVALQKEIDAISSSIHYAGGNCVANCEKWNEHQEQKQHEVDAMKAQLEEQQKRLEEMQESARKQGFGSSVYDPE